MREEDQQNLELLDLSKQILELTRAVHEATAPDRRIRTTDGAPPPHV